MDPIKAWRQWRGRRTLAHAARLLARDVLTQAEYALIAIDIVARLKGEPADREKGWLNVTFSLEAAYALGVTAEGDAPNPASVGIMPAIYGPLGGSFAALPESMAAAYA